MFNSDTSPKFTHTWNTGESKKFDFSSSFSLASGSTVEVKVNDTILDDDAYTLVGTIVTISSLNNGDEVEITRVTPVTQTKDFSSRNVITAEDIEDSVDKLTAIDQEQKLELQENAAEIAVNKDAITAETNRATAEETRIDNKLDAEITRSTTKDIQIETKLNAEITRATSEETRIDDKLDAEITRSTAKDIQLEIDINVETVRAIAAETRIDDKLDAEITRSTAEENSIKEKNTNQDIRLAQLESVVDPEGHQDFQNEFTVTLGSLGSGRVGYRGEGNRGSISHDTFYYGNNLHTLDEFSISSGGVIRIVTDSFLTEADGTTELRVLKISIDGTEYNLNQQSSRDRYQGGSITVPNVGDTLKFRMTITAGTLINEINQLETRLNAEIASNTTLIGANTTKNTQQDTAITANTTKNTAQDTAITANTTKNTQQDASITANTTKNTPLQQPGGP